VRDTVFAGAREDVAAMKPTTTRTVWK